MSSHAIDFSTFAKRPEAKVDFSTRLSKWVADELDQRFFTMKAEGSKITKTLIVEEALIAFLGLERPAE
jgi:hypothetical protein